MTKLREHLDRGEVRRREDHPCPGCGAAGVEVCSGCGAYVDLPRDCGCPCGTGFVCSAECGRMDR